MERFRVLVIDDSSVMRAMMAGVFEADREIMLTGVVASAAEAEELLAHRRVDVITLDVEMPGTDGLSYLPRLIERKIPVVMLSGQTSEGAEARNRALRLGAAACFNKANAVRDAPELLRLVKAAARHQVHLRAEDAAARREAQARAKSPGP